MNSPNVVDCVRRLGGSCSAAILDEATSIYSIKPVDGLIGYRLENSSAVVYGDPVCQTEDWEVLVQSFHDDCAEKDLGIVYISTSETFARWAHARFCGTLIQFGKELVLDPHDDPQKLTGTHASLLRRKVRHAIKEGVVVHELLTPDPHIQAGIEQVRDRWLNGRQGLQIHISNPRVFSDREGKRWFYAQENDRITGVVVLNQLQNRKGWLLNHLMHTDAANGTPELLVSTALDALARENCHYVTFGTVTATELGEINGLSQLSSWMCSRLYRLITWMFHLESRPKFWEKFHPRAEPLYLLFSRKTVRIRELRALMRALNIKIPLRIKKTTETQESGPWIKNQLFNPLSTFYRKFLKIKH